MSRNRLGTWVRMTLVAMLFTLGVVQGVAAAESSGATSVTSTDAIRAKVDRIARKRPVTQQARDAAAAQVELLRNITALTSSTSASVRAMTAPAPVPGGVPDYFGSVPNWAYSPLLRKFVDTLPGLGSGKSNNLGQYIGVAKPDTITYPGSDYYEIELRQFAEKMHSDMPATTLRGYVQVNHGTDGTGHNTLEPDPIHYLGPFIVARKDRPVRIKFTNKLPIGEAGDLFIPVDTSVMGAGKGADETTDALHTQNRGTLHLHGGISPWISDGTPHQWITPAGENTPYPKGVSVKNVPDMPDPGDGSMTFFYTNQQSARLMFYHDHSYGITRLNVYAGEAAGYMITDAAEDKLIADGTIPSEQIPLIIQDKTFVDATTVWDTDPTWNWGTGSLDASTGVRTPKTGDLWLPHVYVPAQNPGLPSGINPIGRWHYGPWFWPPVPASMIQYPPIENPYYDPEHAPWEPELMPATPNPSMGMEAFHDTPMVNGTAYPVLTVQPKSYRLRVLNAANDRFWNLQMYVADPTVVTADGRRNTEVKMVTAAPTAGFPEKWPTDGRQGGVPDPATAGPTWIQIGTEGGFLPAPAIIPQQPVTWNTDQTMFNFGNVQDHSLLLGPAERADVVVDFSAYAGKTLILYNDSPAPFPALDPRQDYYTGMPDMTDTGGTKPTKPGFGPNTRTIMQIRVAAATPAAPFDLETLNETFASGNCRPGVFKSSQNPIIVPDSRYDSAYGTTLPADPYVRIYNTELTFKALDGRVVTIPLAPKAIQDETSEVWDPMYGRMSGKLGLEMPRTNAGNANFVLYSFFDPPTEDLQDSMTQLSVIGEDGTQLWKITHNGVDTHPIHFHLFDVQVINRVGWDGFIRPPDDNELGWKDTLRISPLEDTIVALRPVAPKIPFGLPDSWRPLNPIAPLNDTMGFSGLSPITGQILSPPTKNIMYNFGWEYVWHCHILSHEEMDMMRPMTLRVARSEVATPSLAASGTPGAPVQLTWTDATPYNDPTAWGDPSGEIGYRLERAEVDAGGVEGLYSVVATPLANTTAYVDTTTVSGTAYRYRVVAYNAAPEVVSDGTRVNPAAFFSTYTVSPMAFGGGTISPSTTEAVAIGADSSTYTITANAHYSIADVVVEGESVGPVTSYRFTGVQDDKAIWAQFAVDTYTVTPRWGPNGSITPGTQQTVGWGSDSATFTISPDLGHHVAGVVVDGVPISPRCSYKFAGVDASHTISATFAIDTFTITPTAGPGGSITPNTTQTIDWATDSPAFVITPAVGYHTTDVLVDGVSVGAVTSHTFKKVKKNHTIAATFAINTYTITPSSGPGGSVSPGTPQIVNYGSSPVFVIAPAPGYLISKVLVDGAPVGPVPSYTFAGVTSGHTISATFIRISTITITTNRATATLGSTAYLSGQVTPSPEAIGHAMHVDVKRPGRAYWSYSSARTIYSRYGVATWMYKYLFKTTMPKGTYLFRAFYDGPLFAPSSSTIVSVSLR
jgi:FtsP/CotA-like multicopper oxidase with cupredoxin domain